MGRHKGGPKTGGRKKGAKNKPWSGTRSMGELRTEIRDRTRQLFPDVYWKQIAQQLQTGKLHPSVHVKLLAYAYGEPKQTIDVPGLHDVAEALSRKVIHRLYPPAEKE